MQLCMEFLIRFQLYCDMVSVDQAWTLIAWFSNSDAKNWMDDSGGWWYDSIQPAGETADPSYKAKLASFKIKEDKRRESNFSSNAWDSITKSYSLNLWIR